MNTTLIPPNNARMASTRWDDESPFITIMGTETNRCIDYLILRTSRLGIRDADQLPFWFSPRVEYGCQVRNYASGTG